MLEEVVYNDLFFNMQLCELQIFWVDRGVFGAMYLNEFVNFVIWFCVVVWVFRCVVMVDQEGLRFWFICAVFVY